MSKTRRLEDIDYRTARGLDRTLMPSLAYDSAWVTRHEDIFIIGPTGVGNKKELLVN